MAKVDKLAVEFCWRPLGYLWVLVRSSAPSLAGASWEKLAVALALGALKEAVELFFGAPYTMEDSFRFSLCFTQAADTSDSSLTFKQ